MSLGYASEISRSLGVNQRTVLLGVVVALIGMDKYGNKLGSLFNSLLTHRGFTHSIHFAALIGVIVFLASDTFEISNIFDTNFVGFVFASAFVLGILNHLIEDGIL
jgi:membrane-bound metal-dependent hydrolase YbcI (DUF457 family)